VEEVAVVEEEAVEAVVALAAAAAVVAVAVCRTPVTSTL